MSWLTNNINCFFANDTCSTQDLNTSDVNLFFFMLSVNLKVSPWLFRGFLFAQFRFNQPTNMPVLE